MSERDRRSIQEQPPWAPPKPSGILWNNGDSEEVPSKGRSSTISQMICFGTEVRDLGTFLEEKGPFPTQDGRPNREPFGQLDRTPLDGPL